MISEFEASQVYKASFRTLKAYTTCDLFLNVIHIMIKDCFIKLITELILYLLDIKDTSKFLFIFLYVYDTYMYVCLHMGGGPKFMLGIFLNFTPLYLFRQDH